MAPRQFVRRDKHQRLRSGCCIGHNEGLRRIGDIRSRVHDEDFHLGIKLRKKVDEFTNLHDEPNRRSPFRAKLSNWYTLPLPMLTTVIAPTREPFLKKTLNAVTSTPYFDAVSFTAKD